MLTADRNTNPDLIVENVELQLGTKHMTHTAVHAFVEQTIAQFQRGKWQRYCNPEWEVLLTGRSSLLDVHGKISDSLYTIDPNYAIPPEDWPTVAAAHPIWRWIGDGVFVELSVSGSEGGLGLVYDISLTFEIFAIRLKRKAELLADDLQKGDAKGWNSTAEYEAEKKKRAALNRRLIENAIKRGDSVYQP
jgi:hypothetical protein